MKNNIRFQSLALLNVNLSRFNLHLKHLIDNMQLIGVKLVYRTLKF